MAKTTKKPVATSKPLKTAKIEKKEPKKEVEGPKKSTVKKGSSVFQDVNDEIKANYKTPLNIRFGTEWKIQDFRVRGGFGYYGTPYQPGINTGERYVASGGIGYRGKHFFADLTYVWSQTKQEYYFYDITLVNPSYNTLSSNTILTTFGIRF